LYEAQLNGQASDLAAAAASAGNLQALNSMSTGDLRGLTQPGLWGASQAGSSHVGSPSSSFWGSNNNLAGLEAQALLQQQAMGLGGLQGLSGSHPDLALLAQTLQQAAAYPQLSSNTLAAQRLLQQQTALAGLTPRQQAALLSKLQTGFPGSKGRGKESGGGRLSRRATDPIAEAERKAQQEKLYSLDLEKVVAGEDRRTTLMIKNIPNKYTQKMLLATIDEAVKGTYDFFYLPIDFKNKCNVGYAFINMVKPEYIIPLVQKFHAKKWDKFNSEKVCNISYARIQGKLGLVSHFQNSSLLHEDKRCRPILFASNGEIAGEPEPFPVGPALRSRSKTAPLKAPDTWANTERGKELSSRGHRLDLNQ
jgi:protein phosphatase 1 regulatory subunit 42